MLFKNPSLRELFSFSGSSIILFGRLLTQFTPLDIKSERETFNPGNEYEKALMEILSYDHFFEIFLRDSGVLMTDLKFYVDLSNRLSCPKKIPSLLAKLKEFKKHNDPCILERIYQ